MKIITALSLTLIFTGAAFASDTNATDQVQAAVAKLKAAPNYSWTTTLVMADMPFTPGPVLGSAEKDGFATVTQDMGDNKLEAIMKADQIALKNEGQWQLIDEAEGFAAMMGGWVMANGTAVDETEKLIKGAKELTAGEAGLFSGDLTTEGAQSLLSFRPRGANAGTTPPAPKNAKGSVKFWLKDGALIKVESHVQGAIAMGQDQEERNMDTTRTIEIKDVGTTKVEVPAEAKAKLTPKATVPKPQ